MVSGADNIVFSKVYLSANTRTQSALSREETQDLQTKEKSIQESTKARITPQDSNSTLVLFDTQGGRVQALLSKESIERLREKFNEKDFYTRGDGTLRLNGKAEAYVGGWYGEMIGNMGVLKADFNKDGKFSSEENAAMHTNYHYEISNQQTIFGQEIGIYGVKQYANGDTEGIGKTLDDILDNLIKMDEDLNGKISIEEHFASKNEGSLYSALKGILESRKNPLAEMVAEALTSPDIPQEKKKKSPMEEAIELLAKIKQNGNLNALSPKEQELVKQYFAGEIEQIKQQSQDTDVINQHLDRKIRDFVEQMGSNGSLILSTKA